MEDERIVGSVEKSAVDFSASINSNVGRYSTNDSRGVAENLHGSEMFFIHLPPTPTPFSLYTEKCTMC